ncbi:Phosphatidylinositol 4,5-bisphosphate 3-kinase catalytic subunit gamma isoform [Balamuthia mandrillaris]
MKNTLNKIRGKKKDKKEKTSEDKNELFAASPGKALSRRLNPDMKSHSFADRASRRHSSTQSGANASPKFQPRTQPTTTLSLQPITMTNITPSSSSSPLLASSRARNHNGSPSRATFSISSSPSPSSPGASSAIGSLDMSTACHPNSSRRQESQGMQPWTVHVALPPPNEGTTITLECASLFLSAGDLLLCVLEKANEQGLELQPQEGNLLLCTAGGQPLFAHLPLAQADLFASNLNSPKNKSDDLEENENIEKDQEEAAKQGAEEDTSSSDLFLSLMTSPLRSAFFSPTASEAEPTADGNRQSFGEDQRRSTESERGSSEKQKTFSLQVLLPDGTTLVVTCNPEDTVEQVKEKVAARRSNLARSNISRFALVPPTMKTLPNQDVPLESIEYINDCRKKAMTPQLRFVEKSKALTNAEKLENVEIGALIGQPLCWAVEEDETSYFRRATKQHAEQRKKRHKGMEANGGDAFGHLTRRLCDSPFPSKQLPAQVFAYVNLPLKKVSKGVIINDQGMESADSLLNRIVMKHYFSLLSASNSANTSYDELPKADTLFNETEQQQKQETNDKVGEKVEESPVSSNNNSVILDTSRFVLKVQGFAEYIFGEEPCLNFAYIRECVMKNERPQLIVVELKSAVSDSNNSTATPGSSRIRGKTASPSILLKRLHALQQEESEDTAFEKITYDHANIASTGRPWDQMTCISVWELARPFRVRIVGAERINDASVAFQKASGGLPVDEACLSLFLTAGLYFGGKPLCPILSTPATPCNSNPRWYEWLQFGIATADVPREARLCFTLYGRPMKTEKVSGWNNKVEAVEKSDIALGWVNMTVFDYKHEMRRGLNALSMWPDRKANPIGTCVQNIGPNSNTATQIFVEMSSYPLPVVFPTEPMQLTVEQTQKLNTESESYLQKHPQDSPSSSSSRKESSVEQRLSAILKQDPLYVMDESERRLVWALRHQCMSKAEALPKFLLSVCYADRLQVQEMHTLLPLWKKPRAIEALELLDSSFADSKVREYAVSCLDDFGTEEFMDYLLQLVQVLKYEPHHNSALAHYLLKRALLDRRIGHSFFWYLKSEMHVPEISERFSLLLEAYLRACGSHRSELKKQTALLKNLEYVANKIKDIKDSERLGVQREELANIKLFDSGKEKIQLPLSPSLEANSLIIEKCKYMDSKKLPLWLVWGNNDTFGKPIYTIFKAGDDLRQDMLTLQMIRIMDKLWKKEGMDLHLSPYGCVATGDGVGFIEVVLNSDTTANISGRSGGAKAAFKADPLKNWLMASNKHTWERCVENFILSCAGYCVATYVLGIGDRHNDNVMVTRDGKLFHIDFGHFLGNYKKKLFIKRERAPFVLTPDFCYVMGGRDSPGFQHFVETCCKAYNILRKHANVFINLFKMMLSTGIPELTSAKDIRYLRDAFAMDLSDEEAAHHFSKLITEALDCWTTRFNNAWHMWIHKNG